MFGAILAPIVVLLISAVVSAIMRIRDELAHIPSSVLSAVASILMILSATYVFIHGKQYTSILGIKLCMDGLSAFYALIVGVVGLGASVYSIGYMKRFVGEYSLSWFGICYSLFLLSMYMVPLTTDFISFLVFWELMTLFSALLVAYESRRPEAYRAALKYFAMMMVGAGFIIAAFAIIYNELHSLEYAHITLPPLLKHVVFAFLAVGFGFKAGLAPLHSWLPDAHPEAPSNVSALLSGVMIKMAFYGLMRFLFLLEIDFWWGITLTLWGAFSAIVGTYLSIAQDDSKKLLAYSSVAQVGYIAIALGTAIALLVSPYSRILGSIAFIAALVHIFSHAVSKGSLFLVAGSILYRTGTRDLNTIGGLAKYMPLTFAVSLIAGLSLSGVPPLSGFVSKWMIYATTLGSRISLIALAAALAMFASILTAAAIAKLITSAFLIERSPSYGKVSESPHSMTLGMLALSAMCIVIGIYPISAILPASLSTSVTLAISSEIMLESLLIHPAVVIIKSAGAFAQFSSLAIVLVVGLGALIISMLYKSGLRRSVDEWLSGSIVEPTPRYSAVNYFSVFKDIYGAVYRVRRALIKGISEPLLVLYKKLSTAYEFEQRYSTLVLTITTILLALIIVLTIIGVI
ncbi:MAG: hypothetical protein DRO15_00960 [Thermoprotei archaeon]|nr:MAG: hypothetical protein DRO15_00960 [Thermoprotei archaeon]